MGSQRGVTLLELLAVLALVGITIAFAIVGSLAWIQRQASRSAVYNVQAVLQSARAEAVARNRACQVRIDAQARTVRIIDLNLSGTSDDVQLSRLNLSSTIRFDRPDAGDPITLPTLAPGVHEATFEADGTVSSGAGGEIVVRGGDDYHRVTLFGAGAVRVERWGHDGWPGS